MAEENVNNEVVNSQVSATPNSQVPPGTMPISTTNQGLSMHQMDEIDDKLVASSITTINNWDVDPNTRKSIEAASYNINSILPKLPDIGDGYPGNSSPNRNPFTTSSGMPDFTTPEGREAAASRKFQEANANSTGTPAGYKQPLIYGKRQMNADRYFRHPKFQDIGFHPFQDNETYYNQNSTWWDDMGRTMGAWGDMFGPAFTSSWRAIGDYFTGEGLETDLVGGQSMRDAMRVGSSTRGGVAGFVNDLFLNSSYTAGIISSIFVEEVALGGLTVLSGGIASELAALRTAGNLKRLFTAADKLNDMGRTATNYTHNFMQEIGAIDKARDFYNFAKGTTYTAKAGRWVMTGIAPETAYAMSKINSTKNGVKNLSNLAKASKTFGGFYRDLRMMNLAWAESKLEGGLVELEKREHYYIEALKKNGGADLTKEEWDAIDYLAKSAGWSTSWKNFPVIWLSNKLVLDGALRGFKPIGRLLDETMEGAGGRILRSKPGAEKAFFDAGTGIKKVWNAGWKNGVKGAGAAGLRYLTANFAEGFQELTQEAISEGVGYYYDGLFDEIMSTSLDLNIANVESMRQSGVVKFKDAYAAALHGEGVSFETFMSGFLMGGMVQPFQKILFEHMPQAYTYVTDKEKYTNYQKEKEKFITNSVETLNELWSNPLEYFDITKIDGLTQKQLNKEMIAASYEGRIMNFKDAKDQAIFSKLYTMIELGKASEFKSHIESYLNMEDVDLVSAFPDAAADAKDIRRRFKGMSEKIDHMEKQYDNLKDKYINPYDPGKFDIGTKAWAEEAIRHKAYEQAKMMLMFSTNTYERSIERFESILNKLAIDPAIDKLAANDIAALTSQASLISEIQILKEELAVPLGDKPTKKLKEQYENKKKRLDILNRYIEIFYGKDNITKDGQFDRRKEAKLKKVFTEYLEHIASVNKGRMAGKDKIEEAFQMIIDSKALNSRMADYYKASQVLNDSEMLIEVADMMAETMSRIWNYNKKQYNIQKKLKTFTAKQERGQFLAALAKKGIFADAEQSKIFIQSGVLPVDYYSEDSKINAVTAKENPAAWKIIQDERVNHQLIVEADKKAEEKVKVGEEAEIDKENVDKGEIRDDYTADDLDAIAKNAGQSPTQVTTVDSMNEFLKEDPNTAEMLDKLHDEYIHRWTISTDKNKGPLIRDINKWIKSEWGAPYARARKNAYAIYKRLSAAKKRGTSFDEWLLANQGLASIKQIANKQGLDVVDILYSNVMNEKTEIKKDLESDEHEEFSMKIGIRLIRFKTYNKLTKKNDMYWEIQTFNGDNAYDAYKGLDPEGKFLKDHYLDRDEADQAMKNLREKLRETEEFDFKLSEEETIKLKLGDTVTDREGNEWQVKSTKDTVDTWDNLRVESVDQPGKTKDIDQGDFTQDGWNVERRLGSKKQKKNIDLTADKVTKLRMLEPLQFYAWNPTVEGRKLYADTEEARIQLAREIVEMTPEDIANFEITIERSDDYETTVEGKEVEDLDPGIQFQGYKVNEQIKKGGSKYRVILWSGNEEIAVLQSPDDAVLTDVTGKKRINPLKITNEQAHAIFRTKGDPNAAEKIKANYAAAYLLEEKFEKLIEDSADGTVKMKLTDLLDDQDIGVKIFPGRVAYPKSKAEMTKFDELEYNTVGTRNIDGTPTDIYYIIDQRTSELGAEERLAEADRITNFPLDTKKDEADYKKLKAEIDAAAQNADLRNNFGRYVLVIKTPDGTITFAELKADAKPKSEISNIIQKIKDRMELTKLDESEGGNFKKVKGGPKERVDRKFNYAFNKELDEGSGEKGDHGFSKGLFIAGKPGETIKLEVTEYGNLQVDYSRKYKTKEKNKYIEVKLDYETNIEWKDLKNLESDDVEGFIKLIQNKIDAEEAVAAKEVKKNVTFHKTNLKLDISAFRNHIPKDATFEQLEDNSSVNIRPWIRYDQRMDLSVYDVNGIQRILDNADDYDHHPADSTPVQEDEQAGEKIPTPLNDKEFQRLLKNKLKDVPENILEDIAKKLHRKEELSKQEDLIFKSRVNRRKILNYLAAIKQNDPEAEQIKNNEGLPPPSSMDQKETRDLDTLKKEYKKLWSEKYNKIKAGFPQDMKGLKRKVLEELAKDAQLITLKAKIDELEGSVLKVTKDDWDGRDIQDINVFIEWSKRNLPDGISIEDIDNLQLKLKNNGVTVGAFLMELKKVTGGMQFKGKIYTGKTSPFRYHEAFHAIFRMMLSEQDITKFLKIGKKGLMAKLKAEKKSLDKAIEEFKLLSPVYADMTKEQAIERMSEEWLADEFESFKMNPKESKAPAEVKSWFRKLIEWIMSIFEKVTPKKWKENQLDKLFENIDSGKYKTANVQTNRFTEALSEMNGGVAAPVFAIIPKKTIIKKEKVRRAGEIIEISTPIKIYFTANESDKLTRNIAALYWDLIRRAKIKQKGEKVNLKSLLRQAVDMIVETQNPERVEYNDNTPDQDFDQVEKYEALQNHKREIRKGAREYLNLLQSVEEMQSNVDEFEELEGREETGAEQWDEEANQRGGFKNLSTMLRMFIATTSIKEQDKYGNDIIINPEAPKSDQITLRTGVDYIQAYNGLLKSVAGSVDEISLLKKMLLFGETSVHASAVIQKFFKKMWGQSGYKDAMSSVMIDGTIPTPSDPSFYQEVIKGFTQFRVDYIFALRDKASGRTTLFAANKKDDAHSQLAAWAERFDQVFGSIKPMIETNNKGQDVSVYPVNFNKLIDVLDRLKSQMRKSKISDELLKTVSKEIATDLEALTGISLSAGYVQYSILSTGKTEYSNSGYQTTIVDQFDETAITIEDITELEQSIRRGENIFLDNQNAEEVEALQEDINTKEEENKPEGIRKRLSTWALSNAAFDETVGTTVFLDPKGNYIYAHQLPTYHLQKIAIMNKQGGLEQVMNNDATGYLAQNFLAQDKRMQELARLKKLKAIRMVGMKETTTTTTKDGNVIENKGLDANNMPGVSYGEMKQNEFIANMINMYLLNYNPKTGKVEEIEYKNEKGKTDYFASAPVLIRVLSESNTSDWLETPVNEAIETERGTGEITTKKEYLENWVNEIEKEYNIIVEEVGKLLNPTANEDIIDGFNDANSLAEINNKKNDANQKKHRAYKLTQTSEVATIRRTPDKAVSVTAENVKKRLGTADFPLLTKEGNEQTVFLKTGGVTGMLENSRASVILNGVEFEVWHQGVVRRADVDVDQVIADLGDAIQEDQDDSFKYEVTDNDNNVYYVKSKRLADWFNGNSKKGHDLLHKLKIQPIENAQTERAEIGEFEQEGAVFDNSLKRHLEKQARKGKTFEEAMASFKHESGMTAKEFINKALLSQSHEFIKLVKRIKAERLIDARIKKQLVVNKRDSKVDQGVRDETKRSMEVLNLKANQLEYNLTQIFLNNWLNTKSLNQLLLGNQALKIKDPVDAIKRAKMQNAAGKSTRSVITAPRLGINNTLTTIDAVVFNDPEIDSEFYTDKPGDPISQTDAQVYGTLKGFRYKWFGIGELTKPQAELLDKLEKGIQVTAEEMWGLADKNSKGYIDLKAQINSKKWVYGDGNIFIKMSETYLVPDDDSYIDQETGDRVPYPHRIETYNLRTKLERYEKENDTIIMAVPKSASKMFNKNIAEHADIFESGSSINSKNVVTLDADYMRLQQVTPSNKNVIVDPRQIKNLILNEQDLNTEVTIGNKVMTVGELKALYHYSISQRVELKYLDRRNLIFDLDTILGEMEKSFNSNTVSKDLISFLDFAISALESSQSKSQYLEFFSYDRNTGEPKYELNNPITIQKMSELFMTFFSKGVLAEKQPGHNVVLMSDKGMNVVKRVDARDDDGNPIAWTVISTEGFKRMSASEKAKLKLDDEGKPVYKENKDGKFSGLEVGDLYIDRLRYDVQEYKRNKKGKLMRDKNNQLIPTDTVYAEFILPPHFREILENLDPTKPIPDAIAKQFGVRIPSQDKHSAINLKIVDFMSAARGSTAVFPRELIEVSGADFDIDKLYIQRKEFYTDSAGNIIEYGKGKTLEEQFADYIRYRTLEYQNDKGSTTAMAVKKWRRNKGILDQDKGEIETPADVILDKYLKWATQDKESGLLSGTDPKLVKAKWATENGYDYDSTKDDNETGGFEPLYKEDVVIEDTATDKQMLEFFGKNKHIAGALKILNLPTTKAEYKAYRENNKFEYKYKDASGKKQTGVLYSEPYAGGYNNNILDYKFALLGNNGMTKKLAGRRLGIKNEPAVIDPLTDMWEKIEKRLPTLAAKAGEAGMDIDNMAGQGIAYGNVKEGARNIGAVVLPNVYLGWLRDFKINLRTKNSFGTELIVPRFNSINYTTFDVDYIIDPKTGKQNKQGDRVQYWISALITAMTDNGKHILAGKMGLNKNALGVVTNMIALGIDPYTSIMLINHPTIKELYFQAMHKENPTDPGIKGLVKSRLRALKGFSDTINREAKLIPVDDELLEYHIENYEKAQLEAADQGKRMDKEWIRGEIAILTQFSNMINLQEQTMPLADLANLFKGMGRDIDAVEAREVAVATLGIEYTDREMGESDLSIDVRKIFKPKEGITMQGTFYNIWKEFTQKLLQKQVIYASKPFKKLNSIVRANMGALSPELAATAKSKARKDILSYLDGLAYIKILEDVADVEALASVRNSLIYPEMEGPVDIVEVITTLRDYLKKEGIKNDFINDFLFNDKANTAINKAGINRAKVNSWTKLNDSQIQKLQAGLVSLFDGNKISRAAATHLIHYLLVKDGFQFRSGSYLNIVPPKLLNRFLESSKDVAELFGKEPPKKAGWKGMDSDFRRVFGMTFNDLAQNLLKYFESSSAEHLTQKLNEKSASGFKTFVKILQKRTYEYKGEIVLKKKISRTLVEEQSHKIFVFSDNEAGKGNVGFNSLRNLPNVFTIPVKKDNRMDSDSYYTDEELEINKQKINDAIEAIKEAGENSGAEIVFHSDGIAEEDIYKLREKAPKTADHLNKKLLEEFGIENPQYKKKAKPGTAANIPMDESNIKKIIKGNKTTTIRTEETAKKINIPVGESKLVEFKDPKSGKMVTYRVKNRGLLTIEEAGGREKMLKSEGLEKAADSGYNFSTDWLRDKDNDLKLYVYDIKETDKKIVKVTTLTDTKLKGQQKAGWSPVVLSLEDKTLIVDQEAGNREAKVTYKEGKKQYRKSSKWEKGKKRWSNAITINGAGFYAIEVEHGGTIEQVHKFHHVVRIQITPKIISDSGNLIDGKPEWRYYRLEKIFTPYTQGEYKAQKEMLDVDQAQSAAYGTRAEYVEFDPKGSKQQTPIAFIFNHKQDGVVKERTPYKKIKQNAEQMTVKGGKFNNIANSIQESKEKYTVEKAEKWMREEKKKLSDTDIEQIAANNDGLQAKKAGKVVGDTTVQKADEIINNNVKKGIEERAPKKVKLNFGKAGSSKATITKEDMGSSDVQQEDKFKIAQVWGDLSDAQKGKIVTGMKLGGARLKDILKHYEDSNNQFNLEEFLEQMQKCYK